MYEVLAVVKFNDREALVLNEKPKITYEKCSHGSIRALLGIDQHMIFVNSYYYDEPDSKWQAFGGRKFNIPMHDGTFIKAKGQWWSGGQKLFSMKIGENIIPATVGTLKQLKNCYVFTGYSAIENEYLKLRKTYNGKIWEYWEYDYHLRGKSSQWENDPRNPQNKIIIGSIGE